MVTTHPESMALSLPSWWDQIDALCAVAVVVANVNPARTMSAFFILVLLKSQVGDWSAVDRRAPRSWLPVPSRQAWDRSMRAFRGIVSDETVKHLGLSH